MKLTASTFVPPPTPEAATIEHLVATANALRMKASHNLNVAAEMGGEIDRLKSSANVWHGQATDLERAAEILKARGK